jgi:acetyltransferase-like isoleucine patch superfamily enzyme
MFRNLILKLVYRIRGEHIEIGQFSDRDLLRIFFSRIIQLIRGLFLLGIRKFKVGFFFVGRRTQLIGFEKIKISRTISIGRNVKISSMGSTGFIFGKNFSIKDFSIIESFGSIKKESGSLSIGDNVGISEFCYFSIRGNLTIGDDVIVGPNVKIFTENHSFEVSEIPFRLQDETRNDVKIGSNVWIGSGATILPGVLIGDNVVIAAGSIVNKNVENNSLVGGIPAKLLKNLNNK